VSEVVQQPSTLWLWKRVKRQARKRQTFAMLTTRCQGELAFVLSVAIVGIMGQSMSAAAHQHQAMSHASWCQWKNDTRP
jgi:hypothetical protein